MAIKKITLKYANSLVATIQYNTLNGNRVSRVSFEKDADALVIEKVQKYCLDNNLNYLDIITNTDTTNINVS